MTPSRRKIPRFRIKVKVQCLISQSDSKEPILAQTENLSVKGMRIKCHSALSGDLKIRQDIPYNFKIYIDEAYAPIAQTGFIVYADPNGTCFGIKFSETSRSSEMILSKFVTEMAMNNPELILSEP